VPGRELSVYPTASPVAALILAHGAGAGQRSGFMVAAAKALAARDILTATFDFPYMAEKRKTPDKAPVLEAAWRTAVGESSRLEEFSGLPLFIGGKSMGGRIASQVAADNSLPLSGLVYLGYPLHPPGKPDQRRDRHLPSIKAPMLFVQGSKDAFGTSDEIRALLPQLNRSTVLHEIDGGDHSFKVPARSGRTQTAVLEEVFGTVAAFVKSIAQR